MVKKNRNEHFKSKNSRKDEEQKARKGHLALECDKNLKNSRSLGLPVQARESRN